jgi:mRNA interferase RelE/StbE
MILAFSRHFLRSYAKAPVEIQKAFDKQSLLLLENLAHPSLRSKKYDEGRDLWQARVTRDWRFYFRIERDVYRLHEIRRHPK